MKYTVAFVKQRTKRKDDISGPVYGNIGTVTVLYAYRIGGVMVIIHPRVGLRHPELTDDDVRSAWENQYRSIMRDTASGLRHVAVGYDSMGREVEMVGVELEDGDWLVYHAMTPPSMKTHNELGMGRRR